MIGTNELLIILILLIGLPFAGAALFQLLWNVTMPDVFNLKRIAYWQAFRLIIMALILLGGVRLGY